MNDVVLFFWNKYQSNQKGQKGRAAQQDGK
jgi:hypothetical protein